MGNALLRCGSALEYVRVRFYMEQVLVQVQHAPCWLSWSALSECSSGIKEHRGDGSERRFRSVTLRGGLGGEGLESTYA